MPKDSSPNPRRPKQKAAAAPIAQAARSLPGAGIEVVAIGASAGGLEACTALLDALPAGTGMAFILIQHLDPTHESLMVGLLSPHTKLTVVQAADGMPIEPEHLYIIPPARFLTLTSGVLTLAPAPAHRGARLPFDMLLLSMARDPAVRGSCIVLSGTGADGSVGLLAVKKAGGLVIAQDPKEAGYDGMPRGAIATGEVDAVLPVAEMPAMLIRERPRAAAPPARTSPIAPRPEASRDRMPDILDLLRTQTNHDFTLYKPGTLQRRVERRMTMAAIGTQDMDRYMTLLNEDPAESQRLAKDLLIHVTSFFRDPAVFEQLAHVTIPDLLRANPSDQTMRVWVPGCSTGEEAYSLAILFHEQIAAANNNARLQLFASDVDPDAVAFARDGIYPLTIEADVTQARLDAFFIKEDQSYRVLPELRAMIVFTVQDLLTDPPFSRLNLISCRNVMIYLGSEAQRKVVALFHFALRPNGILLLGGSESVGDATGRFEVISKPAKLFRHIGRSRPGDVDFAKNAGETVRLTAPPPGEIIQPSRHAVLAELCKRWTLETHAPATVLVTRDHQYLYSLGPTERYLRVAPGHITSDVLAMVGDDMRTRLRAAILRAIQDNTPIVVTGGSTMFREQKQRFDIEVYPIQNDGEALLMIHFIDQPARPEVDILALPDGPTVAELERELKTTREELRGAVRSLEISGDEQKAIAENTLSVNEEFQSTNEELLTSKEELQSLNEELTALNSQLQETLEQQRTTSNDLQNVLYSTDVATLFLDTELKIRFFTPAIKALFKLIKSDVDRPLTDLHSLAGDGRLASDARTVLETLAPVEHEVETPAGVWCRRILPYRTRDGAVEGVVITFTDITAHKHASEALDAARRDADLANAAKSRFLAAASHDLRQPLQTLALLHGLLANRVEGTVSKNLVSQIDDTVSAMSGMLNTLLDINQIEAGVVRSETADFKIDGLLRDLKNAFTYHAQARGLDLRIVPCGSMVRSDPRLLEQMLRNLMSNAIKYTQNGKVLVGCRRHGETIRIEIWDTGIGIQEDKLKDIFEEYHQLDNPAREQNRGLGLGLSIVRRLATLLGHRVSVKSRPGQGSVFSVELPLTRHDATVPPRSSGPLAAVEGHPAAVASRDRYHSRTVLVVEDDPTTRALLALILRDEGHRAIVVADGPAAIELVERGTTHPDLLLTDYNLPNGMDGLAVAAALRARLGKELPVIVLTGDISTQTFSAIGARRYVQLNKPVKPGELLGAIRGTNGASGPIPDQARHHDGPVVFVVDDDRNIREAVRGVLEDGGRVVLDFPSGEAFLSGYTPGSDGCLLIDAYLPGMGGLELLRHLRASGDLLPAIVITGNSDVPMAVEAMKAGAADFIEKPIAAADLLASIDRAQERSHDSSKLLAWRMGATDHINALTPRQRQIMNLVLAGHPSKNIAADLHISQRTVENHRASIMKSTGAKSLPALARLALAASATDGFEPIEAVE